MLTSIGTIYFCYPEAMPLSLLLPPSPVQALRRALIASLYAAHRPELADVVAAADLALELPGLWLRPADSSLSSAWLEETLWAAAVSSGLALSWIRVLAAGSEGADPRSAVRAG